MNPSENMTSVHKVGQLVRSYKSGHIRRLFFGLIILSMTSLVRADVESGGEISGAAGTCAGYVPFGEPALRGVASDSKNAPPCTIPRLGTFTAAAAASVDLRGISPNIQGLATTTASDTSASPNAATAGASFFDTVHLISPLIDYTGGVSIIAGDTYTLQISGADSGVSRPSAEVTYNIASINGEAAPSGYYQTVSESANGTYSGNLRVDFTILACPCSFQFGVSGDANADDNSTASFSDPIFIDLPPGWRYTLASQEIVSTPEPASFWLVCVGIMTIGVSLIYQRRCPR